MPQKRSAKPSPDAPVRKMRELVDAPVRAIYLGGKPKEMRGDHLAVYDIQQATGMGLVGVYKEVFKLTKIEGADDRFIVDAPIDRVLELAYHLTATERENEREKLESENKIYRPISFRRFLASIDGPPSQERQTRLTMRVFELIGEALSGLEEDPDQGNASTPAAESTPAEKTGG